MPGPGFRSNQAAEPIDVRERCELGEFEIDELRAGCFETSACVLERGRDRPVDPIERQGARQRELPAPQARDMKRCRRRARQHRIEFGAARHASRERPDRVEAVRKRQAAILSNAHSGRLEAGEATQSGWDAHRAAGVGADGRHRHAIGD